MDFLGGYRWSCPKKFREKKVHLQLNNFTQKLDFHVLWFRRSKKSVQKLGRKKGKKKKTKKEKKAINLIAAKSGLVGMKGYLETYNPMKYFVPYLSRF